MTPAQPSRHTLSCQGSFSEKEKAGRNRFVFLIRAKQETEASMVTIHMGKSNHRRHVEFGTLKGRWQKGPAVSLALLVALCGLEWESKVEEQLESTWVLTLIPVTEK